MWWKHDNIFSRFDTVPACDRQTDRHPAHIYYVLQHSWRWQEVFATRVTRDPLTFNRGWPAEQLSCYLSSDRCCRVVATRSEYDVNAATGVKRERFIDRHTDVTPGICVPGQQRTTKSISNGYQYNPLSFFSILLRLFDEETSRSWRFLHHIESRHYTLWAGFHDTQETLVLSLLEKS